MPKVSQVLTLQSIKNLQQGKKLHDGAAPGLMIHHTPTGLKLWRFKFVSPYTQKKTEISLGNFPLISLDEARKKVIAATQALVTGSDPYSVVGATSKVQRYTVKLSLSNTFGKIFDAWEIEKSKTTKDETIKLISLRVKKYCFDIWENKPIKAITKQEAKELLKKIATGEHPNITKGGGIETSKKLFQTLKQIWKWTKDNHQEDLEDIFNWKPSDVIGIQETTHHESITASKDVAKLLRDIDTIQNNRIKNALILYQHIFLRANELVTLEWNDVNFEDKILTVPAHKMKNLRGKKAEPHTVYLSDYALSIFEELKGYSESNYIFPSTRNSNKPLESTAINNEIKKLGYSFTIHGFRASAKTIILREGFGKEEHTELALAHLPKGYLGSAYNRNSYIQERKEMYQKYSEFLQHIKNNIK